MKKLALVICALIGLTFTLPTHAQEESSILYVAPSRVVMAPGEVTAEINVSNKSSSARRYDLTVVDQTMGEDGLTKRVDTFPYSAKRMLRFVPKRFTLQPGERQVVRVMAMRTDAMADGDYHSHLLFREVPLAEQDKKDIEAERKKEKAAQFEIRALYGVAVPIVVQKGNISSSVALGNVSYVPATDGTPAHLAIEMMRTGNAEAAARLNIRLLKDGKDIPVINEQWVPVYREVDKVTRRIPLNGLPQGVNLRGGKVVLELSQEGRKNADGSSVVETKEVEF